MDEDDRMQLTDYVAQRGIKLRVLDGPETYFETHQGKEYKRFRFRVQLRLDGRTINVRDYTQGELSNAGDGSKVDAADVLNCLLVDASFGEYDFSEFCNENGFDPEVETYATRRRMERTWRACAREAQRLPRFLGGADEYDTARNAEH